MTYHMGKSRQSSTGAGKLEILQRRTFSKAFKRQKVQDLIDKKITVKELSELYNVSRTSVYRWLYLYSPHYQQKTLQVVQMESEAVKTKNLQQQVANLERTVGQKQLQIDYLEKLIELASKELDLDLKKNFVTEPLNSSETTNKITPSL